MHMTYDVAMETLPLLRFTTKNSPTFLLFTWTFLFVKCRPFAMQKPQSSLLDYSVRCNKFSYSQVIYVCSLSTGSTTSFEYEYSAVNRFFFISHANRSFPQLSRAMRLGMLESMSKREQVCISFETRSKGR